ncbi:MAG: glycosyltransferase family 4 protein [Candidatus Schekmanbacteria bacterium]|nr:glycosyltransferase family 4 protein [Candidatus Schekmanbacteria bacterium]
MKLLHINEYYSLEGGLEQYLSNLCLELEARGHENIIVYGSEGTKTPDHGRKSLHIPQITAYKCPDIASKLDKLKRWLAEEKPDIVFVHQVLNHRLIQFLAQHKPIIRFVHGFKLTCPGGRRLLKPENSVCRQPLSYSCQIRAYWGRCMPRNPKVGLELIANCRKLAAVHKKYGRLIVASGFMKQILISNGFDPAKIAVIPYFTYLPRLPENDSELPESLILCVSRLTPEKGVDRLLNALRQVDESAKLVIVGDGPSLPELKEKVKTLNLAARVKFTGWLPNSQIAQYYRQCTLAVVPSLWPEPFGIVGIEAMAYGKPVIAFDNGGIAEWLEDQVTGYLVGRGNEIMLAKKINYLLQHRDTAQAMGNRGRRAVELRFTPEEHVNKLLGLFEDIVRQTHLPVSI